ncbi:hypothetical protein ES703_76330 [subsurface metagenome]
MINEIISYKTFIDDSGKKEYMDPYNFSNVRRPDEKNRQFWLDNYFVLAALVINNKNIQKINRYVIDLKLETFNTPFVEIKSDWLRNPNQRKKHYIEKYNITEEELDNFGWKISNVFPKFQKDIKLIGVVFDKRYYKNRKENDPFCKTAQVLFERIEYFINRLKSYTILVVDQMEGSLSAMRGRNKELIDVLLNEKKMEPTFVEKYARIKNINFRRSRDENFLQLVDLAAYNILRQFVDYGREWEDESIKQLNAYKYFSVISKNFVEKNRIIRGIGLCKLPDIAKRRWRIKS